MTSTPWIEYVAAIATSVSAIVIAWQAWLTRSSVKASERAVTLAEATLRESQIARVEARVPALSVQSSSMVNRDGTFWLRDAWTKESVPGDYVFVLPRDQDVSLFSQHKFTVRNDGPGTATIGMDANPGFIASTASLVIGAGEEIEYGANIQLKVTEWIKRIPTEKDAEGKLIYPECGRITVTYDGVRDSDITETHEIVLRGSVLAPIEDAHNTWRRLFEADWAEVMPVTVLPATRTYWRSRTANEKF